MSLRATALVAAAWACLCFAAAANADDGEASFVLRAGRIIPVASEPIEDGVIVVRDGRIVAIGRDIEVPSDLPRIDMPDATVCPGFVAAATDLAGRRSGDESIGAAYRAVDSFDVYGDFRPLLASGVTTVHLDPGDHRLVSGQGAIVKLAGPAASRILRPDADLTLGFGAAAFSAPALVDPLTKPSADNEIMPGQRQRPAERLDRRLALEEALERALAVETEEFDAQDRALADRWRADVPLRIHADEATDLLAAIELLRDHDRRGYLVGARHLEDVASRVNAERIPVVVTLDQAISGTLSDGAPESTASRRETDGAAPIDTLMAYSVRPGDSLASLRLGAARMLSRDGQTPTRVLAGITSNPAEILGVDDRVGALATGLDADLLILSGDPLATTTHVHRVYVGGRLVYRAPETTATVVRAGTLWLGQNEYLHDGAVLIEDGKIAAVGNRVPVPPHARVIDLGPDAFVTPGFIDVLGHLGFGGDRSSTGPDTGFDRLFGVAGERELEVARAGVTSVVTAPYAWNKRGSRLAAIRTAGNDRDSRIVRSMAGIAFDVSNADAPAIEGQLKSPMDAGKKYRDKWLKYEKELAEWKKARAAGEAPPKKEAEPAEEIEPTEGEKVEDPLVGTWEVTISGPPLPAPRTGPVAISTDGDTFEGRLTHPDAARMPHEIRGTRDGENVTGELTFEGGMGTLQFECRLEAEDTLKGTIQMRTLSFQLEATRTGREAPDLRVVTRSRRSSDGEDDGRPTPPDVDESLEPIRAVLDRRIPILVRASTSPQIGAVLDYLTVENDVSVVLVGAEGIEPYIDRLVEKKVGIILPRGAATRTVRYRPYHQGDDLARHGIPVGYPSEGEVAARLLPEHLLHAVERGMSAEQALASLTVDAARLYGLEERIGAIRVGCDGDLAVFDGHPMDAGTRLLRVIAHGEVVHPKETSP